VALVCAVRGFGPSLAAVERKRVCDSERGFKPDRNNAGRRQDAAMCIVCCHIETRSRKHLRLRSLFSLLLCMIALLLKLQSFPLVEHLSS
jgi:uncharacterized paraquat-inducible protein A